MSWADRSLSTLQVWIDSDFLAFMFDQRINLSPKVSETYTCICSNITDHATLSHRWSMCSIINTQCQMLDWSICCMTSVELHQWYVQFMLFNVLPMLVLSRMYWRHCVKYPMWMYIILDKFIIWYNYYNLCHVYCLTKCLTLMYDVIITESCSIQCYITDIYVSFPILRKQMLIISKH